MYPVDLHVHSTMSDGTFTPKELAFYAKAKGLVAIALTDHDTTAGVSECKKWGERVGLRVIAGTEFSASYNNVEVHILGYFLDIENQKLQQTITKIKKVRDERNVMMLERLKELGMEVSFDELNVGDNNIITRANVARVIVDKGYVGSMDEAFNRYLGRGKPAYIGREFIDYTECIDVIHQAGGLASIAHPHIYKLNVEQFISDLAAAGLDGIESIYPEYSAQQEAKYLELCRAHNLFPSGGSDFHGDNKPGLDIGKGYGKTYVPETLLTTMESLLL
ncbi:MAG: hypothetical protein ATN34_02630 [Epulopiscium sp. Nele67-Bin002]|nr:MAG: hypothetical protein BEN18_04575 [Epulopiscium sp. Nuni2H_MBin001]OON92277.1 MAG: hypothetical protein ATN34_02630 [Epulopiscium sp. Nele67-Bin002]